MITAGRLRWADHVARMVTKQVQTGFKWRNLRKGDHLEEAIILKRIFDK
jgi:hypothetical protein